MYPKVWLDDGKLESILDKGRTALWYQDKINLLADAMHLKIFMKDHIDNLNFIKQYGWHISEMYAKYSRLFSKTPQVDVSFLSKSYTNAPTWMSLHLVKYLPLHE